ncbi:MAG: type II toxin-antitoxin system RelE/ParE family toxin [Caldilineaceae bacterium]|nr:type II toxin-antitoxin system RelE/ParE family toxin [Caldilineaceae bacterium]
MSTYTTYVHPQAWQEIKELPGNMRQRVRQTINDLQIEPRPSQSKRLDTPNPVLDLRRIRLERWRIVYAIGEDEELIDILAVRKRPPYDYGDLEQLLQGINQ